MTRNKTAACMIGKLGDEAKDFTDDELDEIIERLEGRSKARRDAGRYGDETQFMSADAARAAYELRLAAAVTKRNAALNVAVMNKMRAHVAAFSAAKSSAGTAPKVKVPEGTKLKPIQRAPGGKSDVQGLRALFSGSNKKVDGARDSYDAMHYARRNEFVEAMFSELKKEGALEYLQGRKILGVGLGPGFLDEHIMAELWELTGPNGKPGVSGSPEALKVANIIHKYMELARITQNRHGAFIEELRGYIAYQMHDPDRLRAMGFQKWQALLFKHKIDIARTFGQEFANTATPDQLEEALRGVYDSLTSGQLSQELPLGPEVDPKTMGANVAKQVSHRRVVHFTDAKGWGGYNAEVGHGSLMDAVLWTLERGAKTAALMERLGTNPRQNFELLRAELMQLNKSDPDTVKALSKLSVGHLMDAADGAVDQIDSPMFATLAGGVRTVESMASLGGMVLSAVTDPMTQAMRLTYNGRNFFESIGDTVTNFVGGERQAADHLAFGVQGMISDVGARWHGNDTMGGSFGKLNQLFFKANLGQFWDQRRHRAFVATIASELYGARDTHWEALKDDVRATLATYGFGTDEWDVVRKFGARAHESGEGGVIHGEAMRHVPDDDLRPLLNGKRATAGALDRVRDRLERMVRSYYSDQLAWATLQPGTREKALTTQGARRGTALGELARSFFLFKGYPIQFWSKVMGQFAEEDQHLAIARGLFAMPKSEAQKAAGLMASLVAMGYVAGMLKDLAKGRTPRDPRNVNTWGAAFLQGGGLGIYGDFMFGQSNRYGSSVLATLGGPVAGDAELAFKTYNDLVHGDANGAGEKLFKLTKENTPFINIFYARAALDYLFLYRLQEWMSPGSLSRMEQKLKTENNQTYILPPSQVVR